ncbi:MAG: hypothetical protein V3T25_04610 [Gemmatimonadota bacterium]
MSKRAAFHQRIEDARRIHIAPVVIAYHLIGQPPVVDLTRLLFTSIRSGRVRAQTSALSIYQLLTEPYREGEDALAERAFRYLGGHPGLEIVPVTAAVSRQAAEVQARLGGTPERSIQVATALLGGAKAYVADKTALRRIAGMEIISLDEYAAQ